MCGIIGQLRHDGRRADAGLAARMCAALEHRGPDARGLHVEGGVALGIQRLRVIDLATGDQPIYNEDRSVVVVLNGEIYNYRELRAELLRRGHTLTPRSSPTSTRSSARTASGGCTACSPSPSGTRAGSSC
jgi:asparagine synthase (glutamine-hydrolysing)